MASWAELEAAAPGIASAGRELLQRDGHGKAMLATVRDGASTADSPDQRRDRG